MPTKLALVNENADAWRAAERWQAEAVGLQGRINDALTAMDERRYGDARAILKTGAERKLATEVGSCGKGGFSP